MLLAGLILFKLAVTILGYIVHTGIVRSRHLEKNYTYLNYKPQNW